MTTVKKYRTNSRYFLPEPSQWPLLGSCSLFLVLIGTVNIIHAHWYGHHFLMLGMILLVYTLFGWLGNIIDERKFGLHNVQMDKTYRWGMMWFIVAELAFFAAFFAALFYAREVAIPLLGGLSDDTETHTLLWPQFHASWPLLKNPNMALFRGPLGILSTWGLPAVNTCILLISALTVTWAYWGLRRNRHWQMNLGLILTILLGISFLSCQAFEYNKAYEHLGLTLASGIYGTTFFMLTGFHAAHVTLGLIMLTVVLIRCVKGHFRPHHHFGFEAIVWYWHFVDVIWLFLFMLVYWL